MSTKILSGDPSKTGFYSIVLLVPPNTAIQAHSHRDSHASYDLNERQRSP